MIILATFLSGITFATFAAAGVFFFKFWKASRDSFFRCFAWACWLLAIERAIVVTMSYLLNLLKPEDESGSWVYIIRLLAFLLIGMAIYEKNKKIRKI